MTLEHECSKQQIELTNFINTNGISSPRREDDIAMVFILLMLDCYTPLFLFLLLLVAVPAPVCFFFSVLDTSCRQGDTCVYLGVLDSEVEPAGSKQRKM